MISYLPPYADNYTNLMIKHYEESPSEVTIKFCNDVINFHDNIQRVLRLRRRIEDEGCMITDDNWATWKFISDSIGSMLRVVSDMTDASTELMLNLLQLNRELDEEKDFTTAKKKSTSTRTTGIL
ncbi:hypothetical protein PV327_011471 [Microctonus hyperodae]|uniref:Uncharacterized protein n=1 Tax=Microctonus hyperodae TaxID=165561 RepID=A0AA39KPZ3_MICHY|nr:hypothetical protein PV327_011471 [Microctonus hyperodae]